MKYTDLIQWWYKKTGFHYDPVLFLYIALQSVKQNTYKIEVSEKRG